MAKNNVIETLNEMKNLTGYMKKLNEDYFMDDEIAPEMPQEGPEMAHEMQQQAQQENTEQSEDNEKMQHAQNVIQQEPIIAKIRETAIEGLRKYSDQPTSQIYEFMKKVFLEADKVLTSK